MGDLKCHISASIHPTQLLNHSIFSEMARVHSHKPIKSIRFAFCYPLQLKWSMRAISICLGLPGFRGRSPAGLQADFHEFATLLRARPIISQEHGVRLSEQVCLLVIIFYMRFGIGISLFRLSVCRDVRQEKGHYQLCSRCRKYINTAH